MYTTVQVCIMETLFSYKATCNNNLLVTQIIMAETLCRGEKFTIYCIVGLFHPAKIFILSKFLVFIFFRAHMALENTKFIFLKYFFYKNKSDKVSLAKCIRYYRNRTMNQAKLTKYTCKPAAIWECVGCLY